MATERFAAAGGGGEGGGDRGDRSKQRSGDRVYARRSKKARTTSSSGDGVFGGAASTMAVCPQFETHAQELPNQTGEHAIGRLVSKDNRRFFSRSKHVRRYLKGKIQNDLEAVRGMMTGAGLENAPTDVNVRKSSIAGAGPLQLRTPNAVNLSPPSSGQRRKSRRPSNQHLSRTPKANKLSTRTSELTLAKDKSQKSHGSKLEFRVGSKAFKSCSELLQKLLKHKFGYVFDAPVDVKRLGLDDYFTIIKQPMDLGTVRDRLNSNFYKLPKEFAEEVRLTFTNAMTYNPEGHQVHTVARELLTAFDERWDPIEREHRRALKLASNNDAHNAMVVQNTTETESGGVEATREAVVEGTLGETRTDGQIVPSSNVTPFPSVAETDKSSSSSSTIPGSSSTSGFYIPSSPDGSGARNSPSS